MRDRPLSPITERSSFSSSRRSVPLSPTLSPHLNRPQTLIREISYESEIEADGDVDSIYSQLSSDETIIGARYVTHTSSVLSLEAVRPDSSDTGPISPKDFRPTSRLGFNDHPLPGGLLPPPRPRRQSPSKVSVIPSVSKNDNNRRHQSHIDTYPGGRETINLDLETEDEGDDTRSIATATTAGLAGRGARGVSLRVGEALKGIMEGQDEQFRRFRENAPTPPSNRPITFVNDPTFPKLHNIPTLTSLPRADKVPDIPDRSRRSSKLFKSPPASQAVNRKNSHRANEVDKEASTGGSEVKDVDNEVDSPILAPRELSGEQSASTLRRELSIRDALALTPRKPVPHFRPAPSPPSTPKQSIFNTSPTAHKRLTPKKRTSRIIPHVLFSLFSERDPEMVNPGPTDLKIKNDSHGSRPRARLSKSRNRVTIRKHDSAGSDSLPTRDGEVEELSDNQVPTIRRSGTFGVRDDGTDVFHPDSEGDREGTPRLLGHRLRRWSSANDLSTPSHDLEPPLFPDSPDTPRARRTRVDSTDTLGTARTSAFDRDRGLFAEDALVSTDDLGVQYLRPTPEVTSAETEHSEHFTPFYPRPESPDNPDPDIRTPELGGPDLGISDLMFPHDLSRSSSLDGQDGDEKYGEYIRGDRLRILQEEMLKRGIESEYLDETSYHVSTSQISELPIPHDPRLAIPTLSTEPSPSHSHQSLPPVLPNGLSRLPPSIDSTLLRQTSAKDLPVLIASHLLSSHASSLIRQDPEAKDVREEMYKLAQESLEWGRVLLGMTGPDSGTELVIERDIPFAMRGGDGSSGEGMGKQAQEEEEEDTYTRPPSRYSRRSVTATPPRASLQNDPSLQGIPSRTSPSASSTSHRAIHPHLAQPPHQPSTSSSNLPTPSQSRQSDGSRKSESLPPEWFQRVEHLAATGWDRIHQAEEVCKEGMKDEAAHILSAGPSVSSHESRVGSSAGNEHETLIAPSNGDNLVRQGSEKGSSRKLVKSPKMGHSRRLSISQGWDMGQQNLSSNLEVIREGQRSRWWKRK